MQNYNAIDMNGETEGLLALSSTTSPKRSPKSKVVQARLGRGILINRYALLVFLAAVTVAGWYGQHEYMELHSSLQAEQTKVQALQSKINIHEQVIQRFNASITNTDVMNRLGNLEAQFFDTQKQLTSELAATEKHISQQLNSTLQELSTTVTKAEAEISDEVEKVKKDVEQYVLTTQDQFSMENSFMVYQLAGTFTLLSCLISMWHMTAHMRKMNEPDVQRKILAILWMSPLYAVTSWFSLVFHEAEGYLAIIKDGYEAYIIYQFLSFCIAVLGKGDRNKVVDLLANHADHLTPPFRLFGCCEYICGCCKPEPYENNRALADAILLQCQFFAMQFVLFRPLTTTAMVVLGKLEYYGAGDGPSDYRAPQFYITIIQNLSIFIAFTGLLKFYHAVDKDLAWCRPFAKFLCIKGVVFMTFWQGLAISILAQTTDVGGQDETEWAKSAQNFLICLEMLLFSIAHFYCFPTEEWQEGYRVKHEQGRFGDTIALGDFFSDVKLILQSKPQKKKKRRVHSPPKSSRKLEAVPEGKDDEHNDDTVLEVAEEQGKDELDAETAEPSSSLIARDSQEDDGNEEDDDNEEEERSYTTASSSPYYETEQSFEDSQAAAEESDYYESDEEQGMLSQRLQGLSEEDQKITKALERSLGLAAHDPDIAEAARRLLDSKVLSSDFFLNETVDYEDVYGLDDSENRSNDDTDEYFDDNNDAEQETMSSVDGAEIDDRASDDLLAALQVDTADSVGEISTPMADSATPANDAEKAFLGDSESVTLVLPPPAPPTASTVQYAELDSSVQQSMGDIPTSLDSDEALDIKLQQSRTSSEGTFWAFEDNVPTPVRASYEPPPLPTPNEGKSHEPAVAPGTPTPLKPSIFTTVAALAEQSDGEDDLANDVANGVPKHN